MNARVTLMLWHGDRSSRPQTRKIATQNTNGDSTNNWHEIELVRDKSTGLRHYIKIRQFNFRSILLLLPKPTSVNGFDKKLEGRHLFPFIPKLVFLTPPPHFQPVFDYFP